ncbi:SufD family Fe-S cluster assembly protein [Candidatus Roizmanbacteria bacterium]|nr:SufD family Fe-S cluster assembly protein [Candidatus Roizmanbacteria bacterium]
MKQYITKIGKNQKKTVIIDKSGEYIVELIGEGAEANIVGIIQGRGDEKFTIRTHQLHKAPNTTSDLLLKSVLRDESQIDYKGVIKIVKGAQKSNAYQRNENLLLSEKTHVESKPELEIEADDVRCTHGATMGMIDEEQLFYLMSRGLNKIESEDFIVEGFVQDVKKRML